MEGRGGTGPPSRMFWPRAARVATSLDRYITAEPVIATAELDISPVRPPCIVDVPSGLAHLLASGAGGGEGTLRRCHGDNHPASRMSSRSAQVYQIGGVRAVMVPPLLCCHTRLSNAINRSAQQERIQVGGALRGDAYPCRRHTAN